MKNIRIFLLTGLMLFFLQGINSQSLKEKAKTPEAYGLNTINSSGDIKAITLQFLEGFEKTVFPPLGWTVNTSPSRWDTGAYSPRYGKKYARCQYDPDHFLNELLILPEINYSNKTVADSIIIGFLWRGSKYWSVEPENNCDLRFLVSLDGGATWDTLWTEETNPSWSSWTWNTTKLNVSSTVAGQAGVIFAFQYSGQNGAEFDVDQITVNPPFFDVKIDNVPHYCTMIPVKQAKNIPIKADIINAGQGPLTGIKFSAEISMGSQYYYKDSAEQSTLTFGQSTLLEPIPGGFMTNKTGNFYLTYAVTANEQVGNYADDFVYTSISVTDSTYAYDNNNASSGWGAGADTLEGAGQKFSMVNADTLSSVSVYLKSPTATEQYQIKVYTFSGSPGALIGTSPMITVPDDTSLWYRIPVDKIPLSPGDYFIALTKTKTSSIPLGTCTNFYPGVSWVNYNGNWQTVESTGRNISFLLRLNLVYDTAYINHNGSTDISEIFAGKEIILYPNPAEKSVFVKSTSRIDKISIYDVFGQQIFYGKFESEYVPLDVSCFNSGLYLIEIESEGKKVINKLIIR